MRGKMARTLNNNYEQTIRQIAAFYDNRTRASELLKVILPEDSHVIEIEALYSTEYEMFCRRVRTGEAVP